MWKKGHRPKLTKAQNAYRIQRLREAMARKMQERRKAQKAAAVANLVKVEAPVKFIDPPSLAERWAEAANKQPGQLQVLQQPFTQHERKLLEMARDLITEVLGGAP